MRLLRELRHDNLNSFIGAVVEPLRVLLLTDYCAKGSLYVSIVFIKVDVFNYNPYVNGINDK